MVLPIPNLKDFLNLEYNEVDNNLRIFIETIDFLDYEEEIEEFVAEVPIKIQTADKIIHSCGMNEGSCDCPTFEIEQSWINETFPVTTVDAVSGFDFHYLGYVESPFNPNETVEVYTFDCFSGTGLCFKSKDDRFKYAKAIVKTW